MSKRCERHVLGWVEPGEVQHLMAGCELLGLDSPNWRTSTQPMKKRLP
jgi:hypothetical protein